MTALTICYDFKFNLEVKKRNGKTYKHHLIMGVGCNYDDAIWDIYFKLKKKKAVILKVNNVNASRIAFAMKDGKSVSVPLADYPPLIPGDLNSIIKHLLKN